MRRICAMVLVLQAITIGLSLPVAIQVAGIPAATAGPLWGGLAVAALVIAGVQRFAAGPYLGWALQVGYLASALILPDLLLLGIAFTLLWAATLWLGARVEAGRTPSVLGGETDGEPGPSRPH
ncbi:DUF4233 domain-containing protein [Allonocardiopsis opalescens]|uniref:Uncharacterized protein DUF4233 n=1 Tax=Allonocardiopsis opalescens TaxID=1144618 RepID=A0A2T0PXV1_9ACTN|nr:DUF4233 domain-containing protein [Allonocardiopsis opalescens]PRX96371.1 uncharacterized protein DUF4233 [Allonocardiopsis opalescens]